MPIANRLTMLGIWVFSSRSILLVTAKVEAPFVFVRVSNLHFLDAREQFYRSSGELVD
ncbi:unnamed protein product, partial [Tuber aestivum]